MEEVAVGEEEGGQGETDDRSDEGGVGKGGGGGRDEEGCDVQCEGDEGECEGEGEEEEEATAVAARGVEEEEVVDPGEREEEEGGGEEEERRGEAAEEGEGEGEGGGVEGGGGAGGGRGGKEGGEEEGEGAGEREEEEAGEEGTLVVGGGGGGESGEGEGGEGEGGGGRGVRGGGGGVSTSGEAAEAGEGEEEVEEGEAQRRQRGVAHVHSSASAAVSPVLARSSQQPVLCSERRLRVQHRVRQWEECRLGSEWEVQCVWCMMWRGDGVWRVVSACAACVSSAAGGRGVDTAQRLLVRAQADREGVGCGSFAWPSTPPRPLSLADHVVPCWTASAAISAIVLTLPTTSPSSCAHLRLDCARIQAACHKATEDSRGDSSAEEGGQHLH